MTRTDAPKERGGRLDLNCARTAPELPDVAPEISKLSLSQKLSHTRFSSFPTGILLCGMELQKCCVPCGRVTVPQMALIFEPRTSLEAR